MIRVGPAGWAYKDWAGVVYPKRKPKGFHEATYLSAYFDTIELNVSYYRPVSASTAESWVEKIAANPRFRFTAKLWHGFTHERDAGEADARLVDEGFRPLLDARRLGAVLMQFPFSFHWTPENRDYVLRLGERFGAYPLVAEVRHESWNSQDALDVLRGAGIGVCNIDQPHFKKNLRESANVTSPVGYVRLHGRNAKSWWSAEKQSPERYNYLYSVEELKPWVHRIHDIAAESDDVYVVENNHYLGKAVVNGLELTALLRNAPVQAPPQLLERYPVLAEFTRNQEQAGPLTLPLS